MTRQQAIDGFRHEVSGIILDLVMNSRKGAELSVALRHALTMIDQKSAALYDSLAPKEAKK